MSEETVLQGASALSHPDCSLQWLPCTIQHNGPAKVKEYFTNAIKKYTENGEDEICTTFRGRLLVGQKIPLEESTQGFILSRTPKLSGDEVKITGTFKEITGWTLEENSGRGRHNLHESISTWLQLSRIMHQ